jgi:hypothetical protein
MERISLSSFFSNILLFLENYMGAIILFSLENYTQAIKKGRPQGRPSV